MTPRFVRPRTKPFRLRVEPLEERLAPSVGLPADIIVGRTQSAYSTADVSNHTLTVTYTVYNERADNVSGVLLTTSLQPGIAFTTASQLPDRDGPNLAWSLGTLPAYGRASVTLILTLPDTIPTTIDGGAHAFGTMNAGLVMSDTPAVTLTNRILSPDQLASTPDANTDDPFIQEQAAKLRYDPQAIFDYLNTDIGYESYSGSLRGARGTLWSAAGNSLDEASLGVALFRVSGIPARYAHGTLSDPLAKQLILSMFPASVETIGYIPSGSATADPANNESLLNETRDHYWLQIDSGSGFQNADSSGLVGSGLGTAFTIVSDTFTEVADGLRHKVRVSLDAEMYNSASALFGLGGNGLSSSTVLDQTFNSVDLVGRPVTVGNFVNQSALGSLVFSSRTTTYSPYFAVGDDALPSSAQSEAIRGTDFQELQTNFPFGTQLLTGLFLNITLSGPGTPSVTAMHTIVDRIGYAARQGSASVQVSADANSPPPLTSDDAVTVNVSGGLQNPHTINRLLDELTAMQDRLKSLSSNDPQVAPLTAQFAVTVTRFLSERLLSNSDILTGQQARLSEVVAYFDQPRLVIASQRVQQSSGSQAASVSYAIDLLRDNIRAVAAPGQVTNATFNFNVARGYEEDSVESVASQIDGTQAALSAGAILVAAGQQNIQLAVLGRRDVGVLADLHLSVEATARITTALTSGLQVLVPVAPVNVAGKLVTGWFETDPTTGYTIGVMENGGHQGITEYAADIIFVSASLGLLIGLIKGAEEGLRIVYLPSADAQAAKNRDNDLTQVPAFVGLVASGPTVYIGANFFYIPAGLGFFGALLGGYAFMIWTIDKLHHIDPPIFPVLADLSIPPLRPTNASEQQLQITTDHPAGLISGGRATSDIRIDGQISATWSTTGTSSIRVRSLTAVTATITDLLGNTVGVGTIGLTLTESIPATISGSYQYAVAGTGSFSVYGRAETAIGSSGEWAHYSATVTGQVTTTLTTDQLTLDGRALPVGTYQITATSFTTQGDGLSTSPTFAGSATVNTTVGTVQLSDGAGDLRIGGQLIEATSGVTLVGYTGQIGISASASDRDTTTITGISTEVLTVSASATSIVADQNTPATIQAIVRTNRSGGIILSAEAPSGWTAVVSVGGEITLIPAPGLQSGTFAIRVVARSVTNPEVSAQTTVSVRVNSTIPGLSLSVPLDTLSTVLFGGAQLPTAYQAKVRNLGPTADTFTVTAAGLPAGFTFLTSGSLLTIPAGQTSSLGIYLQPNAGTTLPAPGTVLTFTVTATSTTNATITQTQTVSFTMPEVHAVTVTATPTAVSTTPGTSATSTLTITSVGNVSETVSLSSALTNGLTVAGLPSSIPLTAGQSVTIPITLSASASTPLNSNLAATFTATFGPSATAQTQSLQLPVRVAVPGADAIATAATAASELGHTDLANRLNDLSIALTNLVQTPTNDAFRSQALAALDAVIGLIGADSSLATLIPELTADRGGIVQATTPPQIQAAVVQLGSTLERLGQIIADEVAHRFTISFASNSTVAQPLSPSSFQILLRNTGTQTTTYDLTALGLPTGITATFSQDSITLAPGESTFTTGNPDLTVTVTPGSTSELTPFGFTVRATAHDAPAITQTISGSLTVRSELVTVISVSPTPAFTDAGGTVAVSARLLNAVNREQSATVLYTVKNSAGVVIFTSSPVTTTLTVLTSITTVALGSLDTTGLATGDYTITVNVTDDHGSLIAGATGTGHLLIGSPVTASLSIDATSLPPGSGTVTATLQVNSQTTTGTPLLSPIGTVAIPGAGLVQVYGNRAYVVGTGGIQIVDISDPTNPLLLSTFGSADIAAGLGVTGMMLDGDKLILTTGIFAGNPNAQVLVYSLANPSAPALLGQSLLTFNGVNYTGVSAASIVNHHVYTSSLFFRYFVGGFPRVFGQYGESIVIDVSNPTAPATVDVLFNRPAEPNFTYPDGLQWPDGSSNIWQIAEVNANTAYIGTTANTKGVVNDIGQILVVDASNPNDPNVVRTLDIPGMSVVTGIRVVGNTAWVIGSSIGWRSGVTLPLGLNGNIVIAKLDVSDALHPTIVSTKTFDVDALGLAFLEDAGNGLFVSSSFSVSGPDSSPRISLFDTNDPNNVTLTQVVIPTGTNGIKASNGRLFTGDGTNLIIYQIGQGQAIPATARVTVPTADGVAVVPGSFSLPPTRTLPTSNGTTYEWDLALDSSVTGRTITWQETIANVQPGRSRVVAMDGTVSFTSQGTAGQASLADQFVSGVQIIGLTPATQTTNPGSTTTFAVNLANPTATPVTYSLAALGVPDTWIGFASAVTVPANGSVAVPLTVTSDSFAAATDYNLTVTAKAESVSSSVQGTLTLTGEPTPPDRDSHGVVLELTPATATAGQGTSARYVIRVTNTGSAEEIFALSASLPAGVTGAFAQTSLTVPPGIGNFREVTLMLTPQSGTLPGNRSFTVTANSNSANQSTTGTLVVVNEGVSVALDKSSGNPGDTFEATVTNSGSIADTFDVSVSGLGGLVSTLGTTRITLAPGQSQTIPITTTSPITFAVPGSIPFTVTSRSVGNSAVNGSASASISMAATTGLTAAFQRNNQVIPIPGTADFLLLVTNTGNTEDAYSATITSVTGATASLVGLDGNPTSSIATFRLPGLSSGSILVHMNLAANGIGSATVRTQSLNNPTLVSNNTATLSTPQPTPLLVGGSTNGTAVVYNPSNGQLVAGATLTFFPGFTGNVRTATADVTGDGIADYIGGSGPGMTAEIAIIDGATNQIIARFQPFEASYRLGLYVAAADITGDGRADLIVTPDLGGGPVAAIYDGAKLAQGLANGEAFGQPAQLVRFFGIEGDPNFRGGIRPAIGDLNGDQTPDLVISAGFQGGPRIALFNGLDLATGNTMPRHLIPDFFAFESTLRNGAYVAVGDITGDGKAELAFGGSPNGSNRVRIFNTSQLLAGPSFTSLDNAPASAQLNNFYTGDASDRSGVRLSLRPIDNLGQAALITGSGDNEISQIQVFMATTLSKSSAPTQPDMVLDPFSTRLTNGIYVG